MSRAVSGWSEWLQRAGKADWLGAFIAVESGPGEDCHQKAGEWVA